MRHFLVLTCYTSGKIDGSNSSRSPASCVRARVAAFEPALSEKHLSTAADQIELTVLLREAELLIQNMEVAGMVACPTNDEQRRHICTPDKASVCRTVLSAVPLFILADECSALHSPLYWGFKSSFRLLRRCRMHEVTQILHAIDQGDPCAAERLLPLVYDELRQLAAQKLSQEKPGQTLQATALVHEAYVRLLGPNKIDRGWDSRGHFFAAAAEAMRRILIDGARRKAGSNTAASETEWSSTTTVSSSRTIPINFWPSTRH